MYIFSWKGFKIPENYMFVIWTGIICWPFWVCFFFRISDPLSVYSLSTTNCQMDKPFIWKYVPIMHISSWIFIKSVHLLSSLSHTTYQNPWWEKFNWKSLSNWSYVYTYSHGLKLCNLISWFCCRIVSTPLAALDHV